MTKEQEVQFDVFCDFILDLIERYGINAEISEPSEEETKKEGTD